MKIKLERVDEHLKEKLKDPCFKELYELEQQKLSLIKKIIEYRINHNLTQGQLAKKLGITQQHISKIENCEFSSLPTLLKVLLYVGFKISIRPTRLTPTNARRIKHTIRELKVA
ncbi:MAG: helix-turn-helix domain-containing protein [Candidatus Omnitrophota bacterium]|nr:helix-turn-helix domain-containing protein [Candidatus Omnitrophota bacterium]